MCSVCSEGRGTSQQLIPPQRETLPNGGHRSQRPQGQSAKDKQLNPRLFKGLNKASDLHIWGGTLLSPPAGWPQGPGVERCWCVWPPVPPRDETFPLCGPNPKDSLQLCFVKAGGRKKNPLLSFYGGGEWEEPTGAGCWMALEGAPLLWWTQRVFLGCHNERLVPVIWVAIKIQSAFMHWFYFILF